MYILNNKVKDCFKLLWPSQNILTLLYFVEIKLFSDFLSNLIWFLMIVFHFQARIRGLQARLRHQNLVRNAKAKIIQTNLRGWLARKKYQRSIQRVVIVQCQVRRFLAKKQFKKLKIEAKSIHHQKKLNKGTVIQNRLISSGKSAISWHQNLNFLKNCNNFFSFFSSI